VLALLGLLFGTPATAQPPDASHQLRPQADRSIAFLTRGKQRAVWHFPSDAPRPFLYPLRGPSGQSVTRMGHPGAPDHDHHRSIWFAHYKVNGHDFWSENGGTAIRQVRWYAMECDAQEARLAVRLRWFDPENTPLIDQDVVLAYGSAPDHESTLEVQTTLRPAEDQAEVTLEQTNYGIFAVRVSASLSQVFGSGQLTDDEGRTGEAALFEEPHRWVDYSGHSWSYTAESAERVAEGITYFDHPSNTGFPNAWHVRADGWMCASPTLREAITLTSEHPLRLRYLLHVHGGSYDAQRAGEQFAAFAARPPFRIRRADRPHVRYEIVRLDSSDAETSENGLHRAHRHVARNQEADNHDSR
jgi:hypothetical protein